MTARLIIGDAMKVLLSLPDDSVDLIITSPPFLALRSYLPADHPDKDKEIGSEATPGEFLDTLLDLTEEWARVLAPHGSICVELGDTYSGSGGAGGDYNADGLRDGQQKFDGFNHRRGKIVDHDSGRRCPGPGWPEAKSLCLIPELYRFALAYGFNPLTGRTTPPWRVRNVVRWHRPNPPVGALGDKFRPATSDMVVACKSRTRYFDLDAVRNAVTDAEWAKAGQTSGESYQGTATSGDGYSHERVRQPNPAGAPPLDTWIIPTAPYKGSHYATFPPDLVVKPIKAMCPERVCRVCGEASRRIVESERTITGTVDINTQNRMADRTTPNPGSSLTVGGSTTYTTLGWTDCGHDDWRPGVVLDPFAGSGTTLAVATGHGRDAIGIDLDERNADLCRERIGMFLEVDAHV